MISTREGVDTGWVSVLLVRKAMHQSKGEITAGSHLSQCLAYWRSVAFERVNVYILALIESCVPRETQAAVKDMKRPEAQIHSKVRSVSNVN